ncbi:MAG: hypothetical protein L3J71_06575 [Victivallaceae bacterium]|nr:hypothetical protein [Victivallaceae bacterium]
MSDYPAWLPELITLNDVSQHSGEEENWDFYFNFIYQVYIREFKEDIFEFKSKRVTIRRHPEIDGRDYSFHHIVSEDEVTGGGEDDRMINLRRAERIRWPKAIILNYEDGDFIKCWTYQKRKRKGTKPRVHLWFNDEYLVVLEERREYTLFITAFPTERERKKEKLEREFQESI